MTSPLTGLFYHSAIEPFDICHRSWEPEDNMVGCQRLLRSFWASVGGAEHDEYLPGYHIEAPKEWIGIETSFASL